MNSSSFYMVFIVRGALGFIKLLQPAKFLFYFFFLSFFFLLPFFFCFTHVCAAELAIGGLGQPVSVSAAEPLRAMTCAATACVCTFIWL